MVKRFAQISLAIFLVLAVATMASAAPNVASTSQKGSLLVFPKIISYDGTVETYIFIGNDNTKGTYVKCYWMDENQSIEDFHFYITANQPIVFSTDSLFGNDYGPPFAANSSGALVCWAQNDEDTHPVKFNHLYGYAMIDSANGSVFYNGYSFAFRGTDAQAAALGDTLPLDAANNYDACPKYIVTNFVPDGGTLVGMQASKVFNPDLALWPCKQDLRQDRIPTYTKAKFDIWNYNEVKFTGAYKCFKCYWEGYLTDIDVSRWVGFGDEKFDYLVLGGDVARLRVQGVASSVCKFPTSEATPLLGVILYDPAQNAVLQPFAAKTFFGAGYDQTGFVKWDPSEIVYEAAGQ